MGIGWLGLKSARDSLERVYSERAVPLQNLSTLQKSIFKNVKDLLQAYEHDPNSASAVLHNDHGVSDHTNPIRKRKILIDKLLSGYLATTGKNQEEQALAHDLETAYKAWDEKFTEVLDDLKSENYTLETHKHFLKAIDNELDIVNEILDGLIGIQGRIAKEEFAQAETTFALNQFIYLALFIGGNLIVITAVFLTIRHMRNLLADTSQAVDAIAQGDLSIEIHQFGDDELGEMTKKMALMRKHLINIIRTLLRDVKSLQQAAADLSSVASHNANDAKAQIKITEEANTSVKNLTMSIEKIESFVTFAGDVTRKSGLKSSRGSQIIQETSIEMQHIADVVNQMSKTVYELEGHSQRISGITGAIDNIASQTNLLALNASIEAARAGDAGRGFAVVATEVRDLAGKTASSTREISEMISKIKSSIEATRSKMDASVQHVQLGTELTLSAGNAIKEIQQGSEQVMTAVGDIDSAFHEQANFSKDFAKMIVKVTETTDRNLESSGQLAKSASNLEQLSKELLGLANQFKL